MDVTGALWIALIGCVGLIFIWLVVVRMISKLGVRGPCPASFSWVVNNPIRRWYMRPVLDRVGIRPGEKVLELGPGPGAFTIEAARRTEPDGRLIAVDIQPKMIAAVERKVSESKLTNVETRVADAFHMPVEMGSIDRAFLVTVLPEIPDRIETGHCKSLDACSSQVACFPSRKSSWIPTIPWSGQPSAGQRR
jgi:SAM-dependent methyltransferase